MDRIQALESLGFMDTGEQPAPDLSTYAAMVATWRHPIKQPPTEIELSDAWAAIEVLAASTQYQRDRQGSIIDGGYGTWGEQLEIIGEQGIGAFQSHIAAVKAAHPKSL